MRVRPVRPAAVGLALAAFAVLAIDAPASPRSARAEWFGHHRAPLVGTFAEPVGACVDTITSFDPATGRFTCTGTSAWTGTLVGGTTWTLTATLENPADLGSRFTGRIDEVFTGRSASGRTGTLTFVERIRQGSQSSGGATRIRGHIVASTGQLAGSRGHVTWIGTSSVDGSGSGLYFGRLREGRRGH